MARELASIGAFATDQTQYVRMLQATVLISRISSDQCHEVGQQRIDFDRLDEMGIEPSLESARAIGLLAIAGDRHKAQLGGVGSTQLARKLVTVHSWQTDVNEHNLRLRLLGDCKSGLTVSGAAHPITKHVQQSAQCCPPILVVIHDEDTLDGLTAWDELCVDVGATEGSGSAAAAGRSTTIVVPRPAPSL